MNTLIWSSRNLLSLSGDCDHVHLLKLYCWLLEGVWVPKELCDFVLSAIDKGDILNVEFSWIKYKIIRSTGPGYYTAVKVSKRNDWHSQCDTMYH